MLAFHGDPTIKEKYLARVRAHREADEILQSYGYWADGKGCAVGCTIHGSSHVAYETKLGIDRRLAWLEDRIFEGVSVARSKDWPEQFLSAIPVSLTQKEQQRVIDQAMLWMLIDEQAGVLKFAQREQTKAAIEEVASLYRRRLVGETITDDEWDKARQVARSAAAAAAYADVYAAYAAAAAAADAYAAAYAAYAALGVREQQYERMADKLLELLAAAPVPAEAA